jgi:hypothetical protein
MNYQTNFILNSTKEILLTLENTYYDPNTPQRVVVINNKHWSVTGLYDNIDELKITRNIYVEPTKNK